MPFLLVLLLLNLFAIGSVGKDDVTVCQPNAAFLEFPGTTTTSSDDVEFRLWYYGTVVIARWRKEEGFVEIPPYLGRLKYMEGSDIVIRETHHTDSGRYLQILQLQSEMNSSEVAINLEVIAAPTNQCVPNITKDGLTLRAVLPPDECGIPSLVPSWTSGNQTLISGNICVLNIESELVSETYTACANGKSKRCFPGDVHKLCSHYTHYTGTNTGVTDEETDTETALMDPSATAGTDTRRTAEETVVEAGLMDPFTTALQPQNESSSVSVVGILILIAFYFVAGVLCYLMFYKVEPIKRKLFTGTDTRRTAEETDVEAGLMDPFTTESTLKHEATTETLTKDTKLQEKLQMEQKQRHEPGLNRSRKDDEQLSSQENQQQQQQALGIPPVDRQQEKMVSSRKLGPKFPQFETDASRLNSFKDWPRDHHMQSKELAEAGFFYRGNADSVICFFCGKELSDWAPKDEAWAEHEKCNPLCEYVKSHKMAGSSLGCTDKIEGIQGIQSREKPAQEEHQQFHNSQGIQGIQSREEPAQEQHVFSKRDEKTNEEPQRIQGQLLCRTCNRQNACMVFLPCSHNTACYACSQTLKSCNFCQEKIKYLLHPFAK